MKPACAGAICVLGLCLLRCGACLPGQCAALPLFRAPPPCSALPPTFPGKARGVQNVDAPPLGGCLGLSAPAPTLHATEPLMGMSLILLRVSRIPLNNRYLCVCRALLHHQRVLVHWAKKQMDSCESMKVLMDFPSENNIH